MACARGLGGREVVDGGQRVEGCVSCARVFLYWDESHQSKLLRDLFLYLKIVYPIYQDDNN